MTQDPHNPEIPPTVSRRTLRHTAAGLVVSLTVMLILMGARMQERLQPIAPEPARPLAVETRLLQPQPFIVSVHATGTVQAEHRVVLSAQLAARVLEVPLREGARVAKGAMLVRLDEAEQQQEVARLEASADRVAADLRYWREQLDADHRLLEKHSISRRAFDETQRQVDSLEASLRETRSALNSARIRLDYALVGAPFDAYVQAVHVLPGEYVQPGAPLIELLAAKPLKAIVPVAEADLLKLREGQAAQIRVAAVDGIWSGTLDRLYPGLDRGTRSATVEVFLPDVHTATVRPGMAAEVELVLSRTEQALTIPRQALRDRKGETGVFVLEEEVAHWRSITVGAAQEGRIEVIDGLRMGEMLIVTPHPQLVDGRAVIVQNDWRGARP